MNVAFLIIIWLLAPTTSPGNSYYNAEKSSSDIIIFSHAIHVDSAGVECSTCHASIDTSASAQDLNYPNMDVCGTCHDAVNDDKQCGMCHHNAQQPSGYGKIDRLILFSHKSHISRKTNCTVCHGDMAATAASDTGHLPQMATCMNCHDGDKAGNKCSLCHGGRVILADIHPSGWRHQHGDRATADRDWCRGCHQNESFCVSCHRGDNVNGRIHELNYQYTHGLEAQSKSADCRECHDTKSFCDGCHNANLRMPLNHSTVAWRTEHGSVARDDVENCASCHDAADPTCSRGGCHNDGDGIKGTNPRIHMDAGQFSSHGPWHSDDGYFCFQCHVSTHQAGQGFCGYCHGGD